MKMKFLVYLIVVFTFNKHIANFSFTSGLELAALIFLTDAIIAAFSNHFFDKDFLNSYDEKQQRK